MTLLQHTAAVEGDHASSCGEVSNFVCLSFWRENRQAGNVHAPLLLVKLPLRITSLPPWRPAAHLGSSGAYYSCLDSLDALNMCMRW